MNEIVVWTHGYHFQNTRSFLFPLILFEDYLKKNGVKLSIHEKVYVPKERTTLFIESNFFGKKFLSNPDEIFKLLRSIKKKFFKIVYFDLSDSTAILHPQIIKYVDLYSKSQLLIDRNLYKQPFYGNRIFTDFVFRKYKIHDENQSFSKGINEDSIKKLVIHWNSGIGNYTYLGRIFDKIYEKIKIKHFIRLPLKNKKSSIKKKNDLFYNMNVVYSRNTVAWYRKIAFEKLNLSIPKRLLTYKYFLELSKSKVSLSPFGWGEINYRDYESFINCSLLLKPDMSHLETWPNFFQSEHYVSYNWSGDDLMKKYEEIKTNYIRYYRIADKGHNFYFTQLQADILKKNILKKLLKLAL